MCENPLKISSRRILCVVLIGMLLLILIMACSEDNPTTSDLPDILVTPATISLSSTVGQPSPAAYTKIIVNSDPRGSVPFNFSCDASWIALSNLAGTSSGITRDSFSVSYAVASLPVGTYVDSVVITSAEAGNCPMYLEVTYEILPAIPLLRAYPPRFNNYLETPDDPLIPDSFRVTSTDNGHFDFTLSETAEWISLSQTSGTTPDTVAINMDVSSIIWGGRVDTIWATAEDLTNSPQMVICSLYIHPWQRQQAPMPHILYDIEVINDQTAWAVGTALGYLDGGWTGWAAHTEDGGETWVTDLDLLILADEGEYYGLSSIDRFGMDMWVVGQSGIIRHSPDLGETWQVQSTGLADTMVDLHDVAFVTAQMGWTVGTDGLILKTVDGGDTWVQQTSNTNSTLTACHFIDQNLGWIVGGSSTILRTTNGGTTWTALAAPAGDYNDVFFIDANNGWAVGNQGLISYTIDAGDVWVSQDPNFGDRLNAVFFADNSIGWAVGQYGTVLYTDNSGATWVTQNTYPEDYPGPINDLYEVYFLDGLRGWITGYGGEIRYTNCGGN